MRATLSESGFRFRFPAGGGALLLALSAGTAVADPGEAIPAEGGPYSIWYRSINAGGGHARAGFYDFDASCAGYGGLAVADVEVSARINYVGEIEDPPVANPVVVGVVSGSAASFSVTDLLVADSGPEGSSVGILGVDASSARGGTLALAGTNVTYQPPADLGPTDSFSYSILDPFGGTARTFVSFLVSPATSDAPVLGLVVLPDGRRFVRFGGLSRYTYTVQVSEDLIHWAPVAYSTPRTSGPVEIEDPQTGPGPIRYYRTIAR